jgi:hypothetical protein
VVKDGFVEFTFSGQPIYISEPIWLPLEKQKKKI